MTSNDGLLVSPSSIASCDDSHSRIKRMFLGPMPVNVISDTIFSDNDLDADDDDGERGLRTFIHDHAHAFFLQSGGKQEDWGEATEMSVREQMLERWRKTEWARLRTRHWQKHHAEKSRWVGDSFEVGELMGVNVLKEEAVLRLSSRASLTTRASSSAQSRTEPAKTDHATTANETFVTAPSEFMTQPSEDPSLALIYSNGASENTHNNRNSATSSTPLLQESLHRHKSSGPPSPSLRPSFRGAKSDGVVLTCSPSRSPGKGKGKMVHYADQVPVSPSLPIQEEPEPAPPHEVLARTGEDVHGSSAGATIEEQSPSPADTDPATDDSGVVLRDRMLVRVSHTNHDNIGKNFDDSECRITRGIRHEEWAEFLVVWRRDRIELYEDYRTSFKEWMMGHKDLAFVIPLDSRPTQLSLFSPVDLTFCVVCAPTPVGHVSRRRWIFHRSQNGRNIFIFKHKSRSRAVDWMWNLWTYLGGTIPSFFEIHCPVLDTRVRVNVPQISDSVCDFSRENVIDLCRDALIKMRDWEYLIQQPIMRGRTLELCWRTGMKLDWVWLDEDVEGKKREWEVLYGLALRYPGLPTHLEVRVAQHYTTHLTLKDRTKLHEPPSIEGYLHRIRPNSQSKSPIYLSTHDGLLFFLHPSHAHPPPAPGSRPTIPHRPSSDLGSGHSLWEAEVHRGQSQILDSSGFCDLRNIIAVRRAFQPLAWSLDRSFVNQEGSPVGRLNSSGTRPSGMRRDGNGTGEGETGIEWPDVGRVDSDEEDEEAGEEGLAKVGDKAHLRMRRSFELMMRSGHVIRFEAHSRKTALDWIVRLRALISYWALRHRADARAEMELLHAATGWQRLTSPKRGRDERYATPEPPPDPDDVAPLLGPFWNWCVLEGCRSIIKSGRMFLRHGGKGQYRHSQLVLVSGNLIRFDLSRLTQMHHHRAQTINLIDAYVCSGYFAALALRGEFDPDAPPVAKIFQDGLETNDAEEDMLFILWYRPHVVQRVSNKAGMLEMKEVKEQISTMMNATPIPNMGAKRRMLVCRARSQLERDAWCWALNCEIERIVRTTREREQKTREQGELVELK